MAQLVQEADLLLDGGVVAKGLSELDVVVLPAAGVGLVEAARDVGVVYESRDVFKGDIGE